MKLTIIEAAKIVGKSPRPIQVRAKSENWAGEKVLGTKFFRYPIECFPADWQEQIRQKLGNSATEPANDDTTDTIYIGDQNATTVLSGRHDNGSLLRGDDRLALEHDGLNLSPIGETPESTQPEPSKPTPKASKPATQDGSTPAEAAKPALEVDLANRMPRSVGEKLEFRLKIVADFGEFRKENPGLTLLAAQPAYCDAFLAGSRPVSGLTTKLSPRTLHSWQRKLSKKGTIALQDDRRGRPGTRIGTDQDPLGELILGILHKYPHFGPAKVYDDLKRRAVENHFPLPSESTVRRWINNWKLSNPVQWAGLMGSDYYNSRVRVSFGNAAQDAEYANHIWEIDGTKGDIALKVVAGFVGLEELDLEGAFEIAGRRYQILNLKCRYTRRGMSLVAPTDNRFAVAGLLRKAFLDFGMPGAVDNGKMLPGIIKADNGMSFKSTHINVVISALPWQVEMAHCHVRAPWEKPFVERSFRDMQHDLLRELPGFVGHNVAERQAIRSRKGKLKLNDFVSPQDLQQMLDQWWGWYNNKPHGGLGDLTPNEKSAQSDYAQIKSPDERTLDLLLAERHSRKVGKTGIVYDGNTYVDAELARWIGRNVVIALDPFESNLSHLYVFEPDGDQKLICRAECHSITGVNSKHTAALAHVIQAEDKKIIRANRRKGRALAVAPAKKAPDITPAIEMVELKPTGRIAATQQAIEALQSEAKNEVFEAQAREGASIMTPADKKKRDTSIPLVPDYDWFTKRVDLLAKGIALPTAEHDHFVRFLALDKNGKATCEMEAERVRSWGNLDENKEATALFLEDLAKNPTKYVAN